MKNVYVVSVRRGNGIRWVIVQARSDSEAMAKACDLAFLGARRPVVPWRIEVARRPRRLRDHPEGLEGVHRTWKRALERCIECGVFDR